MFELRITSSAKGCENVLTFNLRINMMWLKPGDILKMQGFNSAMTIYNKQCVNDIIDDVIEQF